MVKKLSDFGITGVNNKSILDDSSIRYCKKTAYECLKVIYSDREKNNDIKQYFNQKCSLIAQEEDGSMLFITPGIVLNIVDNEVGPVFQPGKIGGIEVYLIGEDSNDEAYKHTIGKDGISSCDEIIIIDDTHRIINNSSTEHACIAAALKAIEEYSE